MAGEPPTDSLFVWNGVVARLPALVVQPTCLAELAAAVRLAADHGLELRLAHGHTDAPPAERAVTIDLGALRLGGRSRN